MNARTIEVGKIYRYVNREGARGPGRIRITGSEIGALFELTFTAEAENGDTNTVFADELFEEVEGWQ